MSESQPLYVNSPHGIALAHNGNLTNADELRRELFEKDRRHLNTNSEILLNVFAHELAQQGFDRLMPDHIFHAVEGVHRRCRGAYAVTLMIPGFGLVAFQDPFGLATRDWPTHDSIGRRTHGRTNRLLSTRST